MYRKIRKYALAFLRHFPALRQYSRRRYYRLRAKQYTAIAQKTSTESKTVLFECFGGRQFSCSPRALYERMCSDSRFDDYTFIWSFGQHALELFKNEPALKHAEFVVRGSEDYFKACARAKHWIINTRIAEYITPKTDQVFVQCWHGTPLKRLGYDVEIETANALNTTQELADRFGLDARKWSYLLSPSPYTSKHLADAFGLPAERRANVVLEEGYPRNDRVAYLSTHPNELAAEQKRIKEKLGIPKNKRILLYAPTWRDDAYQAGMGYVMQDTLLDFNLLKQELEDEWCVLFRAHYYIANSFDFEAYGDFVIDASKREDINELYLIADALLTDYSSVFFDYANTKRPLLFFWPDFDHYANDIRGFYFDLKELPGPHCFTSKEVAEALKTIDQYESSYGTTYAAFREKFCPKDDGDASLRVINQVFKETI